MGVIFAASLFAIGLTTCDGARAFASMNCVACKSAAAPNLRERAIRPLAFPPQGVIAIHQ